MASDSDSKVCPKVCPKGCTGVGYMCKRCRALKELEKDPDFMALRGLIPQDEKPELEQLEQPEQPSNDKSNCSKGCNGVGRICKRCRRLKEMEDDPEFKALKELNETDEMFFNLIYLVDAEGDKDAKQKLFDAYKTRKDANQSFSASMINTYEQMANECQSSFAMNYLAIIFGYLPEELKHIRSNGVVVLDYKRSFELYKRALAMKNTLAAMNLGIILGLPELQAEHIDLIMDCIKPFVESGELSEDKNTLVKQLFNLSIKFDPDNFLAREKLEAL